MTRDELERELVGYDKQKLITNCLKLFDANVKLVESAKTAREESGRLSGENLRLETEMTALKEKPFWHLVNQWLEFRIESIRSRREKVFI